MRTRTLLAAALAAALASGAPAQAAPKKPITKTYEVTTPAPHPYPASGDACSDSMEGVSEHREKFVAPARGTFAVAVTQFIGDYDIGLFGDSDKRLANGGGVDTPSAQNGTEKETLKYKVKKKMNLFLDVCNFAGGPTAKVTYTFTYA